MFSKTPLIRALVLFCVYLLVTVEQVAANNACFRSLGDLSISSKATAPQYVNFDSMVQSRTGHSVSVGEHRFVALSPAVVRKFDIIETCGVLSCAAVIFRDYKNGAVTLSHLLTLNNNYNSKNGLQIYLEGLIHNYKSNQGQMENLDVTVVWGNYGRDRYQNRIKMLVEELSNLSPNSLKIDATKKEVSSGLSVYLDLSNGQIFKAYNYEEAPRLNYHNGMMRFPLEDQELNW